MSPALLRAWEQRYTLLDPERSPGGLRLYCSRDEERVRAMCVHLAAGLSAAEAAQVVLSDEAPSASRPPLTTTAAGSASELTDAAWRLGNALEGLDGDRAQQALDRLLAVFAFETVAREVLLPYLVDVGARWQRGEPTIAEEHLATQVLRARLLALTHGSGATGGARVVLACPPDEHHDLALMILAAALERRGCPVTLLGANTPVATVLQAAERTGAQCVVMAVTVPERIVAVAGELTRLAAARPLFLAGPGADEPLVRGIGATKLVGDPIAAAGVLAERHPRG